MLFVCYPKCSTCKKAQKWLDESGAEYTLRDIKTDNPTAEELKTWWEKSGLPLKRSQAHKPHRGREFRQFQPGAAEKLTSQSRFAQQLPYRGEPLAKRKSFTKCQSLPSIGEVARRQA